MNAGAMAITHKHTAVGYTVQIVTHIYAGSTSLKDYAKKEGNEYG